MHPSENSPQSGLLTSLRFGLLMFALCGVAYPLLTTLLGQALFPWQAAGSLLEHRGKSVGSQRVGQSFVGEQYFHGRPSAAGYDPRATAGSNLAPSNPALRDRVSADSQRIQAVDAVTASQIPVDLVAASGSGLDPHISPASARLQISRIARVRAVDESALAALVDSQIEGKQFGLLGQSRINVLQLNLALDQRPMATPTAER